MPARRAALGAGLLALGALSACATAPPAASPSGEWLAGRLSLRAQSPGEKPRSVSAGFELRGDARDGQIQLSSPLGTLLAQARWTSAGVWLTTAEGEQAYASLDELAQRALGEAVPLQALPDWLRGRPAPGLGPASPRNDGFEQAGWRVGLARFADGAVDVHRGPSGTSATTLDLRVRLEPTATAAATPSPP